MPIFGLAFIGFRLASLGVFTTIIYCRIILDILPILLLLFTACILIPYAIVLQHNWVCCASVLMRYCNLSQPNGICIILKFINHTSPSQGLNISVKQIIASQLMVMKELTIYIYIISNFIGGFITWMLVSAHQQYLHNCETRTKYVAGDSYNPYFGDPGYREGQFVHRKVPWCYRGLYRWKTGDGKTVGPIIRKSGKSETCAFRRHSRLGHFRRLYLAWLAKPVSAQESALWDPVTPPADRPPSHMDAMGAANPPWPLQLVRGVLRTCRLPDDIVGALSAWFWVIQEEGGPLSTELRSRLGLHAFLGHLTSRVDPSPGMERLVLLGFDQDGTV